MRNTFLKSFSKSGTANDLVEHVLQPMLDEVKDVTNCDGKEYVNATQGELYMGKIIAAGTIQKLIDDIVHYKEEKIKVKDIRDQMN